MVCKPLFDFEWYKGNTSNVETEDFEKYGHFEFDDDMPQKVETGACLPMFHHFLLIIKKTCV
ncbi:hypothetical protein EXN66_Car020701 [Channa argus]|uniref:Uncharacterized protein n=1 Tax=Channa argus TaxID=215402 RepID=A0A6G1QQL4_CHAAH|nr:hypothetical protein EXN66_Car020701 [Channa argus]